MIQRSHVSWLFGIILFLAVSGSGWIFLQAKHAAEFTDPAAARRSGRPIPVRTARAVQSYSEEVIGATSATDPSSTWVAQVVSDGGSSANTRVKAVHVTEGDHVTADQVLLELDETPFALAVKQQELALASAALSLRRAEAEDELNKKARRMELDSAEDEVKYREKDFSARDAEYTSLKRLDVMRFANIIELNDALSLYVQTVYAKVEAHRRLERAADADKIGPLRDREALALAGQQFEAAKLALEMGRRDLERCQIRSPIDGDVDVVKLVAGSVVNLSTPLFQVFRLDPLHVRVDFPMERIDSVAVGQDVEVVLDSLPKERFAGKVIRISPQVNTALRVLPVVVRLENPKRRLKAGISGFARLHVPRSALTVPAAALVEGKSKAMVFRVERGQARLREVRTGHLVRNGEVEVTSGLDVGDEVVIFHNFYHSRDLAKSQGYLQDGDPVDVNWREWTKRE